MNYSGTVLSNGATLVLSSGDTASATVDSAGGTDIVLSGALAVGTTVYGGMNASGGTEYVSSGGVASGTTIVTGLSYQQGGIAGVLRIGSGGVAKNIVVSAQYNYPLYYLSGASVIVSSGGIVSGGSLQSYSPLQVQGGTTIGIVVGSGGVISNTLGAGLMSATIVSSGGLRGRYKWRHRHRNRRLLGWNGKR